MTSHDVVNIIRRSFGTRRVGHAGTLDPLATGLLVVAVGPATRFLQYLPLEPKVYEAKVHFGFSTDTYDLEGERSEEGQVPEDLAGAIEAALPIFRGLIQQFPPLYSAIKVKGKPLYKYARSGAEAPVREARTVHIGEFKPLDIDPPFAWFRIECSGGTYIRSLAHDLGESLGCGAHLAHLIRTDVGRFNLSQAVPLADARPSHLIPLSEALLPMPMMVLDPAQTAAVRDGKQLVIENPPQGNHMALKDPSGEIISVARIIDNILQPECVIPLLAEKS